VEAVVWTGPSHSILESVVQHSLQRHMSLQCPATSSALSDSSTSETRPNDGLSDQLVFGPAQLQTLLSCKAPPSAELYNSGSGASASTPLLQLPADDGAVFAAALSAFEQFTGFLKSLPGMPLQVLSVSPAAPQLRYTAVLPPVTHPMAHAAAARYDHMQTKHSTHI
jgi:hypothetical protein